MSFLKRWLHSRAGRSNDPRLCVDATEPEWIAAAAARRQRVVFADWVGVWTITEDGRPFFAERVDLADQIEVTDARERNLVWFRAAERYPDLVALRPVRRQGDLDCPHCGGTGVLHLPGDLNERIWCCCGGLGWLPAGYVDPRPDPAV
jgi:hypothetical protein